MQKKISFLLKFFTIFVFGEIVIPFLPLRGIEDGITGIEANALNLQATGNTVLVGESNFLINAYCIGTVSSLILLAIIFSLKRPELKTKIGLWAIGTAILFTVNLGRVYTVLWSGVRFGAQTAEAVHIISWFVVSGIIIGLWYYLTKRIAKIEKFNELL